MVFFSPAGGEEIISVPSMGDSITEGTIVEWTKQPGDSVEVDEVVVVLETDKVSKWSERVGWVIGSLYDSARARRTRNINKPVNCFYRVSRPSE